MTSFPNLPRPYLFAGIAAIVFFLVLPYQAASLALKEYIPPTRIELQQLRTYQGRRRLAGSLAFGLGAGVALGLAAGLLGLIDVGIASLLAAGLLAGLVTGVVDGLEPLGAVAVDPRDPLRNDLLVWVTGGLTFAVALGLLDVLSGGLPFGIVAVLATAFALGLAWQLAWNLGGNAWLRYCVAMNIAARRRLHPVRLSLFLRWANSAGILRISGNAYQFRHNELRDWLQRQG